MKRTNMFGLAISRDRHMQIIASILLMLASGCASLPGSDARKKASAAKTQKEAVKPGTPAAVATPAIPATPPGAAVPSSSASVATPATAVVIAAPAPRSPADSKAAIAPTTATAVSASAKAAASEADKAENQMAASPGATGISETQLVGSNGAPAAFGPTIASCGGSSISSFSLPTPPGIALGHKTVTLVFEGGPDTNTGAIAEYLASKGVKATFFLNGCRFEGRLNQGVCIPGSTKYPLTLLKRITAAGHRIGNFSEYQSNLMSLPPKVALDELRMTAQLFDPFITDGLYLFKTAGNCWNNELAKAAQADPYLRKLTGPFGFDSYGNNLDCIKRKLSVVECAKEYVKDLPQSKSGIMRLNERSNGKPSTSKYLLDVTKCLVAGLGPDSSCPRPLLKEFKIVPLDAIAGIKTQFAFKTPVVWGSAFGDTTDGGAWRTNPSYYGSIRLGDVSGDGLVDVCGRGPAGVKCALSSDNGVLAAPNLWLAALSDASGVLAPPYSTSMQLVDVDGDGKSDLCIRQVKGLTCYRSNGKNGFSKTPIWLTPFFADKKGWIKPEAYETFRMADINGDGFADACGRLNDGVYCVLANRQDACPKNYTGFCPEGSLWSDYFSNKRNFNKAAHMMLGDINGDKRADLCFWKEGVISCALSDGSKFSKVSTWSTDFSEKNGFSSTGYYYKTLQLVDVNGSGKKDLCGYNGTGVVCAFSNGSNGFINFQYVNNSDFLDSTGWAQPEYGSTFMMIDGNSKHKAQICFRGVWGMTCATL